MIIDFHAHLYPPSFTVRRDEIMRADKTYADLFSNPKDKTPFGPEIVIAMEKSNVDKTVVLGFGWTSPNIAREANSYLLSAAAASDGRLIPFCSVNPAWGADAVKEVELCAAKGARGIGELHPDTQNFDIADARTMSPLMDAARALNLPVLVHSSEPVGHCYPGKGKTTPDKLWAFIQNFPRNKIVCAHWGGGLPFYALMPEVLEGLKNVYFDTAASPFLYKPAIFESITRIVGAEHILLGTDYPILAQTRLLHQLANANLTDHEKHLIRGQNARNLLSL